MGSGHREGKECKEPSFVTGVALDNAQEGEREVFGLAESSVWLRRPNK